jgi:WD40 repeat protein
MARSIRALQSSYTNGGDQEVVSQLIEKMAGPARVGADLHSDPARLEGGELALEGSFGGYSSWVNELAYSSDGERLAAIYNVPDYLVQIWQLPEGAASFKLTGGHFTRVVYSADGRILATVRANPEYDQYGWPAGFVQLWSATDGKELAQLEMDDAVSIAFSPNSQILATGSINGTLRLWERVGGRMLMEVNGHYRQIERLIFTPDGVNLVSGSQDGTIMVWGVPGQFIVEPTGG